MFLFQVLIVVFARLRALLHHLFRLASLHHRRSPRRQAGSRLRIRVICSSAILQWPPWARLLSRDPAGWQRGLPLAGAGHSWLPPPRESSVLGCWLFRLWPSVRVDSQWGSGVVVALQPAQAGSGLRLW
ncbi:hypothetical protein NDU88_006647 [Pleurodeles waltl]|uniref:Secreted protein n=1 Tax=Pleurodeles waltl TaxID=8319 RepID=A0AAV7QMD7_PLEWA|nr:hypothetical protein NDU88_006647 [Pleurodeles waltl]